mmetsp:Transcript_70707/g.189626  ORF Transcript_70707/g.189626 Transcript_70707/m.189626 type:complete len:201 (+) Transcript_70707:399-1001(+)
MPQEATSGTVQITEGASLEGAADSTRPRSRCRAETAVRPCCLAWLSRPPRLQQSPQANTWGTLLLMSPSTSMAPRASSFSGTASRPSHSVLGVLPKATTATSAVISEPSSSSATARAPSETTVFTLHPTAMLTPRRSRRCASTALPTSASRFLSRPPGARSAVLTPSAAMWLAVSQAMMPPPRTTSEEGSSSAPSSSMVL